VGRWLIYALGGGFGHLTRACALARQAAASQVDVSILTNSPYVALVKSAMPQLDITPLDPSLELTDARAAVFRWISDAAADVMVVDTFPRGLVGELVNPLAAFSGLKVLVQRDLNPQYVIKYELKTFIAKSYDLVLEPGVTTAPWLIRSHHELPDRESASRLLGVSGERPCIVICAAGNPGELPWYGEVASSLATRANCDVRCVAPRRPGTCPFECWISYWPAMDLYPAADVLIGGAGYNSINEAAACGLPLICRPWPRKYDLQELRARDSAVTIVAEPEQAAQAALELLTGVPTVRRFTFLNGAEQAVKAICNVP
jgi:predicted glycosyltransferase